MQRDKGGGNEIKKDRRMILREKREKKKVVEVRRTKGEGEVLRKVTVKIGLKRIDIQKEIMVETLLDSKVTVLVMSLEFARKQRFKVKKMERSIYVINIDGTFNKEELMKNTVEVNIYYQGHKKRTEIDVIGGQKWSVILGMLWLTCYNLEINWKTEKIKMTKYPEKCRKKWRPKQEKSG